MILIIYSILKDNSDLPVVFISGGTDIFMQTAHVAHHVPRALLMKRKDGLVNCKYLAEEEMSDIIRAAHCIYWM